MARFIQQNIIRASLSVFFIVFFQLPHASGQYNKEFYETVRNEYSNQNIVQLTNKYNYDIRLVKGEIEIIFERTESYMILKNSMGTPFDQSIYSSSFKELVDFEANSFIFDGEKYKKKPITSYSEKINAGNHVFYDDLKEYKFVFPGTTNGSIVSIKTKHKITNPRMLNSIFINYGLPIREFELLINVDNEINLELLKFNMADITSNINKTSNKSTYNFSLQINNTKVLIPEDHSPSVNYFAPHVIPIIRTYSYNNETIDVLNDNTALYRWYYSFLENLYNNVDMVAIKSIADSITSGCSTETQRVDSIFRWVQKNIKYIAFEYGLGGFIPRKPDDILNKRYGDCKDNTALLHALLKSCGIQSYFTWIGTNDLPYTYSEVSSPATDNHMILTYIDPNDQYHFLDATGQYHWYSLPTSFIQGKEALISMGSENFKIKKVPVIESQNNAFIDKVKLELIDNVIYGKATATIKGYGKIETQYNLIGSDKKDQSDYLESILQKGSNKFILSNFETPSLENYDSIMNINYEFTLDNYTKIASDKIYLNLNLYRDWIKYKPKKDRKHPIEIKYLSSDNNLYEFKIPEDYKVDFLPENCRFENEKFNFTIKYSLEEDKIIYHHYLEINELMISMDFMEEFQLFFNELEKAYKQTVILSRK